MASCNRKMNQVEVQVLELQVLQAIFTCFPDVTMIAIPELSQANEKIKYTILESTRQYEMLIPGNQRWHCQRYDY